MNPYEILGLQETASMEDVKKRFHELAKQFHPDTCKDKKEKNEKESKFAEITQAYNNIKNRNIEKENKHNNNLSNKNYNEFILNRAKRLIALGDLNAAINLLSRIEGDVAKDAAMLLGEAFLKKERYHEALKHFKVAYDLDPWNTTIKLKVGYVYEKIGLKNSAKKIYQDVLAMNPTSNEALKRLSKFDKKEFNFSNLFKKR